MRLIVAATLLAVPVFMWVLPGQTYAQSENQQPQNSFSVVNQKLVEVKSGDNLSIIASQNQTTYPRLFDANPDIEHPDIIYPGDKVRIPDPNEQLVSRPLPTAPTVSPAEPVTTVGKKNLPNKSPAKTNYSTPGDAGIWASLAKCESGGNWAANTGNGYYGGLQFTLSSWRSAGGSGYPHQASSAEQIARAQVLQSRQGWGAWPACSAKIGL